MYSQTKLNGTATDEAPTLAGGVRDLTCDVISLAELQGKLLLTDLVDGRPQLVRSAVLLAVAPMFGLAGLTTLALGISAILARHYAFDLAITQTLVASVCLAIAVGSAWWGYRSLAASVNLLHRSRSELSENVAWLKAVLQSSPQAAQRFATMRQQTRF